LNSRQMLEIEWLDDESDCDTCGANWARGARVTLNGEHLLMLRPTAACFNGNDWSDEEIFREILNSLGYNIIDH